MQPPKKGPFFRPSNGNGIIKGANSANAPRKRPGPRQIQPPPKGPSFKFAASPFRFERVIHEETKHIPVARLAHGLDRVLFSPGVHVLQDTRTNTFNFDPILQNLAQPDEFNFDALPAYKIASGDPILREVTESQKQKYFSSTSSITSVLAQFYHVLTENRGLNISEFSQPFADQPRNFTSFQRKPHSIILKHHNGIYSIDQEKAAIDELEEVADDAVPDVKPNEILMQQGKSMEKLLTAPKEEYETYLKSFKPPPGHTYPQEEAFHYANIEGFLLRSQLDCHHPSLGTFDIKTRATVAIRMDPSNYRENTFYKLTHPHGLLTSYERELHDTARSAMLKYNLQVRIGGMDGIFVAYHNTKEMFGFEYLSRERMNRILFGGCAFGDAAFSMAVKMAERVCDLVVERYGGKGDVRVTLQPARDCEHVAVFAEPVVEGLKEGQGPLTKWRLWVVENSYRLCKDPESVKRFRPEKWQVEIRVEEVESREAVSTDEWEVLENEFSAPKKEIEAGTAKEVVAGKSAERKSLEGGVGFTGEEGAGSLDTGTVIQTVSKGFSGEEKKKKPGVSRSLYADYANVRKQVPGLERDSKTRSGNEKFVETLRREVERGERPNYLHE